MFSRGSESFCHYEGGYLKLKNVKDKIIMSAAVGFTAASGITPVFAQETTNAEVIKEDVEAKNL